MYFSDDYDVLRAIIHDDDLIQHYDDHQKLAHASFNDGNHDDFRYALVGLHDGRLLQVKLVFDLELPVVVPIWISGEALDFLFALESSFDEEVYLRELVLV